MHVVQDAWTSPSEHVLPNFIAQASQNGLHAEMLEQAIMLQHKSSTTHGPARHSSSRHGSK